MNQKRNNDELLTTVFGSKEVLEPAPTDVIPQGMMRPEIAYQIVKDETYPQTQPPVESGDVRDYLHGRIRYPTYE